jgi:hypothetical protein
MARSIFLFSDNFAAREANSRANLGREKILMTQEIAQL